MVDSKNFFFIPNRGKGLGRKFRTLCPFRNQSRESWGKSQVSLDHQIYIKTSLVQDGGPFFVPRFHKKPLDHQRRGTDCNRWGTKGGDCPSFHHLWWYRIWLYGGGNMSFHTSEWRARENCDLWSACHHYFYFCSARNVTIFGYLRCCFLYAWP